MKEKANVQSAAPRKVKGTVLFTVVCVMMVLIVFLMGTLALASTANNRANAKYQKTQTEAIARTVLDSVAQAIADDDDATGVRSVVVAEGSIPVTLDGVTYTVNVTNTGRTQNYYDIENSTPWQTSPVYQLEVQVDKTKANTTYSAFVTAKTETTGGGGGGGGGGGAFVSMGDTSKVGTGGFITGGTYVGIDNPAASYTVADNDVYIDAPYYVNAPITTGGGKGLILHYTAPGNMVYVNGNMEVTQTNQLKTDYTGFQWSGSDFEYYQTPYLFVEGELKLAGNSTTYIGQYGTNASSGDKVPTNLYLGSLNADNSGIVVYGDIYTFNPGGESIVGGSAGDYQSWLYKWAQSNVSITNNPTASSLYGNWFSKGSVTIKNNGDGITEGDLRSEKDITLTGMNAYKVNGNIICGGTLTIAGPNVTVTGQVYAGRIVVSGGNLTCAGSHTYEAVGFTPTETYTGGGTVVGYKSVWYENVQFPSDLNNAAGWFGNGANSGWYKYSYEKYEDDGAGNITHTRVPAAANPWDPTENTVNNYYFTGFADYKEYLEAGQDATYNELREFAAHNAANKISEPILAYDIQSKLPGSMGQIYPAAYEQGTIKATINQPTPVKSDYTSYYTNSSTFSTWGQHITDASGFTGTNFTTETDANGNQYYVIKADCHLDGMYFDKNVYIDPSANIRVIFDNCTFKDSGGVSVIVNDTSYETTLYVIGTFANKKGAICTEYYWNELVGKPLGAMYDGTGTNRTITVTQQHLNPSDPDYPNVIIMSDPGATLDLSGNDTFVTALIRAPQMVFKQDQGFGGGGIEYIEANGSPVYYGSAAAGHTYDTDGHKLSDGTVKGEVGLDKNKISNTGVIGQLIADDIILNNDKNWGMIFVEIPSTPVPPTPPTPGSTNPFAGESTVLFYDYY